MCDLYLQCNMGAAGDMLMAALYEICPDKEEFLHTMQSLKQLNVLVNPQNKQSCGINGTHMSVYINGEEEHCDDSCKHEHAEGTHSHAHHSHEHVSCTVKDSHTHSHSDSTKAHQHSHSHNHEDGHHHSNGHSHTHFHASLDNINSIIDSLPISEKVKADAKNVYALIAEAESSVHGVPVTEIHFHEVGKLDAIADVVGVSLLIDMIKPHKIMASAVAVGSGNVRCAHGVLPVPAPATAKLLCGMPFYAGSEKGELCTPTGAALLKYFVNEFCEMPVMTIQKIGYGLGSKQFEAANCVRAFLAKNNDNSANDKIFELSCNLDDMTGEQIGYACEILLNSGALDVFTLPIHMKKNRPATMLTVLCRYTDKEKFAKLLLQHTTTIGVRVKSCERYILNSEKIYADTKYGKIGIKCSKGYGLIKHKAEYCDIKKAADDNNASLMQIQAEAENAFLNSKIE